MTPQDLGLENCSLGDLVARHGVANAQHMRAIFDGTGPAAHRNAVAVNAGAMFYLNSRADSLREGTELALRLLEDGTVQDWITTHEGTDYSV